MKKYKLIDNALGWLIFVVAAATYLLTIEPTASFWDCPEFIAQAFKSEVGHPPGNPIFILVGRLAANFAGGDVMAVSKCVNAMSAILSAATILLLFWTITHLVKKLVVKDGEEDSMSITQYLAIMGSGICGALVYTWSDTFWFSAVEAEVYAFSSFCTALVVWLMLKWEDHADEKKSDRWLILIAYVFGFSLGVHLLNLLCIPALALIFYYRKWTNTTVKGSIITLLVSFAIIVAILYGLEPGFVEMGGYFDLFFVNTLGMSYNTGVIFYAVVLLAVLGWCIYTLYKGTDDMMMRISFFAAIVLSGMLLIGDVIVPIILILAFGVYIFKYMKVVPRRLFSNIAISVLMIFIGFSCYGLIIIRSNANLPLDENSPNTMFGLSSYLSREQYGKTPLLWGPVYTAQPQYQSNGSTASPRFKTGAKQYARVVKTNPNDPDRYVMTGYSKDYMYPSEVCMLFPRIHSQAHTEYYNTFFNVQEHPFDQVMATVVVDESGNEALGFSGSTQPMAKPSFADNLAFFFGYQLNYMYMRYFMWNFAGRQNDVQGLNCQSGDVTRGNWITGFDAIDNARLGDQELLPDDYGKNNKGHNVFYCLPLLLGLIGLLWQAFSGKKGIEQFWVVFFLFFMTGIAIVLYLNQTPMQPRERDYAYAGSFYAFAIWVGMGVAGIWRSIVWLMKRSAVNAAKNEKEVEAVNDKAYRSGASVAVAAVAAVIGLIVPLQMVSQTWDDHDRSYRTAARDFGMNYLSSLEPNAIIFTNGDNDTFPLWYLQEVEGYRTDVRVINLSYLATDWYIAQMQRAAYKSAPVPMQATSTTFAYGDRQGSNIDDASDLKVPVSKSLEQLYSDDSNKDEFGRINGVMKYPNMVIPVDVEKAVASGIVPKEKKEYAVNEMEIPFDAADKHYATSSEVMALDIINSSITGGFKRPVYFACTVADDMYKVYKPYMQNTGLAYQITPLKTQEADGDIKANTDKMYENVTKKFRWGGLDTPEGKAGKIYLDETVRRMVNTNRTMIIGLAVNLAEEAEAAQKAKADGKGEIFGQPADAYMNDRVKKAAEVLALMQEKLPEEACSYNVGNRHQMAQTYNRLYELSKNEAYKQKAEQLLEGDIMQFSQYTRFNQHLAVEHSDLSVCSMDTYTGTRYIAELCILYKNIFPDKYNAMLKKVGATGVSTNEIEMYVAQLSNPQLQQQQMQPAEEPADTTKPQGKDEGEGKKQDENGPIMLVGPDQQSSGASEEEKKEGK